MRAIDFRLRPPYKEFNNEWYFGKETLETMLYRSSLDTLPPSAWERSMELLLQEMDESGVQTGVLVGRYEFNGEGGDKLRIPNDTVVELMEKYPGRFVGLISANPYDTAQTLAELEQYVVNGPCCGIALDTGFCRPAMRFDDAKLYPIYDYCQKHDVRVLLGSALIYDRLETSEPKAMDNVAADFPNLKIVMGHGGWPHVTESCWIALKRPNFYLSPDFFLYGAPGWNDYVSGINNHLKDKIFFGTAYPFAGLQQAIDFSCHCGIREEVLDKYFYTNAAHFLGLAE